MFQYISDIHLECMGKNIDYSTIIQPAENCPYLILAGDIGRVFYQISWRGSNIIHYDKFIEYCSLHWKYIFVVLGNHESWGKCMIETQKRVQNIAAKHENVFYMENSRIELPDLNIYIAGCTLWSNISELTLKNMGDRTIKSSNRRKINSTVIRTWHHESVKFVNNLPELSGGKKWILVTHHCPFLPCQTENLSNSIYDDGYYSNMELDNSKISHAVFGHNHVQTNEIINGIHYISNPFGYPDEKKVKKLYNPYHQFRL